MLPNVSQNLWQHASRIDCRRSVSNYNRRLEAGMVAQHSLRCLTAFHFVGLRLDCYLLFVFHFGCGLTVVLRVLRSHLRSCKKGCDAYAVCSTLCYPLLYKEQPAEETNWTNLRPAASFCVVLWAALMFYSRLRCSAAKLDMPQHKLEERKQIYTERR